MGIINVDPTTETVAGFDVVDAGVYKLKITDFTTDKETKEILQVSANGHNFIKPVCEFVDSVSNLPAYDPTGTGAKVQLPPKIFPWICVDEGSWDGGMSKQAALRGLVEACGLSWGSFDGEPSSLFNLEFMAKVKVRTTRKDKDTGELVQLENPQNEIARYIKG